MGTAPSTPMPSTPMPSTPSPMSGMPNILQNARETVENLAPSAEAIKSTTLKGIEDAYRTIKGSGSIMTELGNVKDSFIGMPANLLGGALGATAKFMTLHPIEGTRTAATGLINAAKDMARFVTAPLPLTFATAKTSLGATKTAASTVAGLPKQIVLKGYGAVDRGLNSFLDLFGPTGVAPNTPPAPDLGTAPTTSTPITQAV